MTELLKDISRQPEELSRLISHAFGEGKATYQRAVQLINEADHLYITGIGSSWHAGMAIQTILQSGGRPACLLDASESKASTGSDHRNYQHTGKSLGPVVRSCIQPRSIVRSLCFGTHVFGDCTCRKSPGQFCPKQPGSIWWTCLTRISAGMLLTIFWREERVWLAATKLA